jgi:hypothetical protein
MYKRRVAFGKSPLVSAKGIILEIGVQYGNVNAESRTPVGSSFKVEIIIIIYGGIRDKPKCKRARRGRRRMGRDCVLKRGSGCYSAKCGEV